MAAGQRLPLAREDVHHGREERPPGGAALGPRARLECDWSASTCSGAAQRGQLEVLQWLRAEGCPWDFNTCYLAVYGRHLETLRWARENGCQWRATDRDEAAAELGYTDDLGNLV